MLRPRNCVEKVVLSFLLHLLAWMPRGDMLNVSRSLAASAETDSSLGSWLYSTAEDFRTNAIFRLSSRPGRQSELKVNSEQPTSEVNQNGASSRHVSTEHETGIQPILRTTAARTSVGGPLRLGRHILHPTKHLNDMKHMSLSGICWLTSDVASFTIC